jgi:hypothetical protein
MVMMFVGGVVSVLDGIPAEFFVPAQTHRHYPIKAQKQILYLCQFWSYENSSNHKTVQNKHANIVCAGIFMICFDFVCLDRQWKLP